MNGFLQENPDVLNNWPMLEEANVHLSGSVNKQNWSPVKELHQKTVPSTKVAAWCVVSAFSQS